MTPYGLCRNTLKGAPTKLIVKVKTAHTLHDNRVHFNLGTTCWTLFTSSAPLIHAIPNGCCALQIGSTEVDLSDVFANNHEEVSAPLFTRV